jgi:hypothetical protein
VADQKEDVEALEGERLDHEQISCPDGTCVVGKEGTPDLAGRPGWPAPPVAADGAGADDDAELEQLTADALGAPVQVLARHGGDQRPDLRLQARPSQRATRTPAPKSGASPGGASAARSRAGPRGGGVASSRGGGRRRAGRACHGCGGEAGVGYGGRPGAAGGGAGPRGGGAGDRARRR